MRPLWIVVVAGGTIVGLAVGFRQSMGLFLPSISADLGIGRESFALGMGLMNLVWGVSAPFAGALADRHGAGRVTAGGGICYAVGLLVLTASGEGSQLLLGGALIGLGLSGAGYTVVLGTVGRLTPPEHRGRALGLVAMGGSIGQFVALPYTQVLIGGFGWAAGLAILAASALLIVPLAVGIAGRPYVDNAAAAQSMGEAFAEAWGDRNFWLLNAGFFVCGFHLAFIAIHLPGFLADKGFQPWLAATALTVVGICNIVGSYVCAAMGERFRKKNVLSVLYLARAAIFALFLAVPVSEYSVMAFAAAMGFLWLGTVPLTSGLVAQLYGTTYMSMVFGMVFFGHQVGGFLGAWLAGRAYDVLGGYDAMWWLCIALGLLSAAFHWPIAERPVRAAA